MNRSLSARERSGILEDLESTTFDLLVIGGGITGAGIAWDAAKRGMKTALIEKNDFAFGTSSRSTKLIHGGLRYLKKGEVKLVREVGREREWLHRHAPHLVTPMPMLLPIYKGGTFGYFSTSVGLYVYDRLAGVKRSERRMMYRRDDTVLQEPLLKQEGLLGSGRYYEYRSDDARLTIEVLKTAVRHGAWAINYTEAADFMYYRSKICGVKAVDRLTGRELEIRAKRIINAAGPWVDPVRSKDHALKDKRLLLTKGVHLVVDHAKLPVRQAAYFDVPDGRMIFVIPRDGKTYIGTTDTVFTGNPDRPRTTAADRQYLLDAVNGIFQGFRLDADDVEAMWAGLRPLISEEGKKPSDVSRRDEIWESASGLITLAGGKLTGFRKMAEKAVDYVAASLAQEVRQAYGPCTTDREMISGGDGGRFETWEELKEELLSLGIRKGLSPQTAAYLVKQYGSNTVDIYMRMDGMDRRFAVFHEEHTYEPELEHEGESELEPEYMPEYGEEPSEEAGVWQDDSVDGVQEWDSAAVGLEEEPDGRTEWSDSGAESGLSRMEWKALEAELRYSIEEEMTVNAADFLVRRTGMLYFDREKAEAIALDVLDIMQEQLGWNERELMEQKRLLAQEWEAATLAPERE